MKTVKIFKDTSNTDSECWLVECLDGSLAPMFGLGPDPKGLQVIYENVQEGSYLSADEYAKDKGELLYVIDAEGRILVDTGPLVAVFAHRTEDGKVLAVQADGTYAPLYMQTVEKFTRSVYKCCTKCAYIVGTAQEVQDTLGGLVGYIDNKGVYNAV